jgi:hypothetical protein
MKDVLIQQGRTWGFRLEREKWKFEKQLTEENSHRTMCSKERQERNNMVESPLLENEKKIRSDIEFNCWGILGNLVM